MNTEVVLYELNTVTVLEGLKGVPAVLVRFT